MRLPRLMLWKQFFLMCFMCCLGSMLIAGCGIEGFVYLEKPQRMAHDPSDLAVSGIVNSLQQIRQIAFR